MTVANGEPMQQDRSEAVLEEPILVATYLRQAITNLNLAHRNASMREGERGDLNGEVRDLIFGLNTAVEALAESIEYGRWSG